MKWGFIFLILIGCSDNSEDEMRFLISSLQNESKTYPENAVFVLLNTGQSNSDGFAPNTDIPINEQIVYSAVQRGGATGFNNMSFTNTSYKHGIELGFTQRNPTAGFEKPFYYIEYALGYTEIVRHLSGGDIYTIFWNDYVKPRINQLIAEGKRPFVYLYWLQGERDSSLEPELYADRFDTWVDLWKTNLGADLPFIIPEIIESNANDITINDAFRNKALIEPNMRVINTQDLTDIGDGLHFDYEAYQNINDRMIPILKELTPIEIKNPL